jgi:hypothetical protein
MLAQLNAMMTIMHRDTTLFEYQALKKDTTYLFIENSLKLPIRSFSLCYMLDDLWTQWSSWFSLVTLRKGFELHSSDLATLLIQMITSVP